MGARSSRPISRFHLAAQEVVDECGNGSVVKHLHVLVTGATSGIDIETARVLACNEASLFDGTGSEQSPSGGSEYQYRVTAATAPVQWIDPRCHL
ncbi:unnamed protein product [Didymodactylos carnosus]|uniref:Uncharacterized protein n=1 Tax=Didymodactylos carnosus TaxID=1234261 RepID=A0A8S2DQC8_9BILA|nr:unnamed protein product [Didymodactylos carnosus]CAF3754370.1 unnamed protein product [Didymodactylos carnosus]